MMMRYSIHTSWMAFYTARMAATHFSPQQPLFFSLAFSIPTKEHGPASKTVLLKKGSSWDHARWATPPFFMRMGTKPDAEFGTSRSLLVIWHASHTHPLDHPKNSKLCMMHAAHRVCKLCTLKERGCK